MRKRKKGKVPRAKRESAMDSYYAPVSPVQKEREKVAQICPFVVSAFLGPSDDDDCEENADDNENKKKGKAKANTTASGSNGYYSRRSTKKEQAETVHLCIISSASFSLWCLPDIVSVDNTDMNNKDKNKCDDPKTKPMFVRDPDDSVKSLAQKEHVKWVKSCPISVFFLGSGSSDDRDVRNTIDKVDKETKKTKKPKQQSSAAKNPYCADQPLTSLSKNVSTFEQWVYAAILEILLSINLTMLPSPKISATSSSIEAQQPLGRIRESWWAMIQTPVLLLLHNVLLIPLVPFRNSPHWGWRTTHHVFVGALLHELRVN
mmetsp:Transcript_24038/g.58806  ORF Transcript_24038/g.58806 Transcript_24038/m.58806 type:complete len:318 (+) Transcript_24038:125-1078(+)